jgi:hypothetical protein
MTEHPDSRDPQAAPVAAVLYPLGRIELAVTTGEATVVFCEAPSIALGSLPAPLPENNRECFDTAGARWTKVCIQTAQLGPTALIAEAHAGLGGALKLEGSAKRRAVRRATVRLLAALAMLGEQGGA